MVWWSPYRRRFHAIAAFTQTPCEVDAGSPAELQDQMRAVLTRARTQAGGAPLPEVDPSPAPDEERPSGAGGDPGSSQS